MDNSPALIPLVLTAVAGLAALELRRGRASVIALGAAVGFFAVAMLIVGALELGVGAFVAGAVLLLVFNWGIGRTVGYDALPALPSGMTGLLAVITLVAFVVIAVLVAPALTGLGSGMSDASQQSAHVGLLRELLVVVAAAAAVWAMLRKTGRRDE